MEERDREGKAASEGCVIPEGNRDQFCGGTLGNMGHTPQRNFTCVSRKQLVNLYSKFFQPLLEGFSLGLSVFRHFWPVMGLGRTSFQGNFQANRNSSWAHCRWAQGQCLHFPTPFWFDRGRKRRREGRGRKESLPKKQREKKIWFHYFLAPTMYKAPHWLIIPILEMNILNLES